MTIPLHKNIEIIQGSKFEDSVNWYGAGKACAVIVSLTVGCPTILEVTGHGLPAVSETPIWIEGVKGARSANTGRKPVLATYIDADHFSIPVSTQGETYKTDTGSVEWYLVKSLTSWTARMQIREDIDDVTPLVALTSAAGDIVIRVADARITYTIATSVTETLDFINGVYDLEMVDASNEATRIMEGNVTLSKEVTR